MNKKKILMIIVLILFILVIGYILLKVNNKAKVKNVKMSDKSFQSDFIQKDENNSNNEEILQVDMNNVLEITDNYFIAETNDIYLNLEEYVGTTIKIEGLIYPYIDTSENKCYSVIRQTPGCCGSDGMAGLDIEYDGEYPESNTWVEIIGVITKNKVKEGEFPLIKVSTMKIKEKGVTFVTN